MLDSGIGKLVRRVHLIFFRTIYFPPKFNSFNLHTADRFTNPYYFGVICTFQELIGFNES